MQRSSDTSRPLCQPVALSLQQHEYAEIHFPKLYKHRQGAKNLFQQCEEDLKIQNRMRKAGFQIEGAARKYNTDHLQMFSGTFMIPQSIRLPPKKADKNKFDT